MRLDSLAESPIDDRHTLVRSAWRLETTPDSAVANGTLFTSTFARLRDVEFVQEPTTMPWGNRSVLLRDPDGNLINLFTPVPPEAAARVAGQSRGGR
jgi:catechol 2,3-dioxygenase-like lactoylglutathione lyase family enzyme